MTDYAWELSIVIPFLNEEKRIGRTLKTVVEYARAQQLRCQYVFVDDGSRDRSVEVIQQFFEGAEEAPVFVRGETNRGKGWAVREGMLRADGKYILFMDADLSVPMQELGGFLELARAGAPIVIGSRKIQGARVEVPQPKLRQALGKVFTRIANGILGTRYSDFTCGFKLFEHQTAKTVFGKQKLHNWSFDAEDLYLASRLGVPVREVPVQWVNDPATKVRLYRDVVTSFFGLIKIRCAHFGEFK